MINFDIIRIFNEVSPLSIHIKKRKCSRNCIQDDFDIFMIYQTITVSVCSSLLHDKITELRFKNESDT